MERKKNRMLQNTIASSHQSHAQHEIYFFRNTKNCANRRQNRRKHRWKRIFSTNFHCVFSFFLIQSFPFSRPALSTHRKCSAFAMMMRKPRHSIETRFMHSPSSRGIVKPRDREEEKELEEMDGPTNERANANEYNENTACHNATPSKRKAHGISVIVRSLVRS